MNYKLLHQYLRITSLWLNNHNWIIVIQSYLLHSIIPHYVRWLCWTLHASYICLHFTNCKMRNLFSLTNTSMLKLLWRIYKWMQVSLFSTIVNTKYLEWHECDRIWLCTFILWTFFVSNKSNNAFWHYFNNVAI